MSKKTKMPNFFKSLIIAVTILVVLVGLIIGFNAIGLPSWPFIFFVFYFTAIANMAKEKLLQISLGGFIGMTVGFSQNFLTLLTNNETVGLIGFLILVIVVLALMIDGKVKAIETFCMFMVTVLTGYTGGLPADQYVSCVLSYVIAVVLFAIISTVMSGHAENKQVAASDSDAIKPLH